MRQTGPNKSNQKKEGISTTKKQLHKTRIYPVDLWPTDGAAKLPAATIPDYMDRSRPTISRAPAAQPDLVEALIVPERQRPVALSPRQSF